MQVQTHHNTEPHRIIAIVGPTASNKTALALHLAKTLNAEVVNADAFQVYRGLDIGTAKPSRAVRAEVPHHLIDILEPSAQYNVARFIADATDAVQRIHNDGKHAILVGGSGQYIKAFTEGWQIPAVPPDENLRNELTALQEQHGVAALAAKLRDLDPETAKKVDLRNPPRLIRAIERTLRGADVSQGAKTARVPYKTLLLGTEISRAELHQRVERRILNMFESGWRAEVEALLQKGVTADMPAMKAIGYRDIIKHIHGEMDEEMLYDKIKIDTHRLIRHQYNWFKPSRGDIDWVPYCDYDAAYRLVTSKLGKSKQTVTQK